MATAEKTERKIKITLADGRQHTFDNKATAHAFGPTSCLSNDPVRFIDIGDYLVNSSKGGFIEAVEVVRKEFVDVAVEE